MTIEDIIDEIIETLEDDPEVYRADEDVENVVVVELIDGSTYNITITGESP